MGHILYDKALAFAERVLDMSDFLLNGKSKYSLEVAVKQVTRCGTSIGANIAEGLGAQSDADLKTKHSVALKEAFETKYWLTLLMRKESITPKMYDSLNSDLQELLKMLVSSVKTLNSKVIGYTHNH